MKIQYQNDHITVFESAIYQTTCTWIRRPDYQLLVDPNYLPIELDFLEAQVRKDGRPLYLFFTHSDYDHIVGYSRFADLATVVASAKLANHPDPDATIQAIHQLDAEFYIERKETLLYPKIDIIPPERGYPFTLGDDQLRCYRAIGHNRDGLILYHQPSETLIVGDYLSALEFPLIYESLNAYISTFQTLESLLSTPVQLFISGHGAATSDWNEMYRRLTVAWQYIEDLKAHILSNQPFPEAQLWQQYRRSDFLEKMHRANIELVRKELIIPNSIMKYVYKN